MSELERLLARGLLQRVVPDAAAIGLLMDDAERHLRTAETALVHGDPSGAYQLAYDAARKAATAMLLSRGLRTRGAGAHANLIVAIEELFSALEGIEVFRKLDRIRRTRNEAEYRGHVFDEHSVRHDMEIARAVVDLAHRALGSG